MCIRDRLQTDLHRGDKAADRNTAGRAVDKRKADRGEGGFADT